MNLNEWALDVWRVSDDHGFHDENVNSAPPMWCSNLHGEVSELWEAYRRGNLHKPCDKPIPLTCAEEELADIIIRALDNAQQLGIDIERAVRIKTEYNRSRSFRHGGKLA